MQSVRLPVIDPWTRPNASPHGSLPARHVFANLRRTGRVFLVTARSLGQGRAHQTSGSILDRIVLLAEPGEQCPNTYARV